LPVKGRFNFETHCQFIDLQERGLVRRFRAVHSDVVKMRGESGEVEVEGADRGFSASGLFSCIHDLAQGKSLEGAAFQVQISANANDRD